MKKITKNNIASIIGFKKKKKSSPFGIIILITLLIYTIGIVFFIYLSHLEIRGIYVTIDENKLDMVSFENEIKKLKKERENIIISLDLKSDNSVTKFISSFVSFNNKKYIPDNLISIKGDYIYDIKGNQILRKDAKLALEKMSRDFYLYFNKKIVVISAYRSYAYQQGIKRKGCPDNLCAKAGYSEHQSGLAVDLWEATTKKHFMSNIEYAKYFNWLNKYAYEYGFINTYQKGVFIDGYEIEPWHWRYVGIDLARNLNETNMTIAEFYKHKVF